MRIAIAILALSLSGCAVVPPWWVAHKVALIEVGVAAGVISQVESAALNTRSVVKAAEQDIKK